jgi:hypothetical protein
MYGQWVMDGAIVEMAMAVARDFVGRPSFFTQVPDEIAAVLSDLWYRSGSDPRFPDHAKRAAMFGAVFCACDWPHGDERSYTTQFHSARDAVLEAAVRFSQRTFDEGRVSLRRAVHDRLVTLREYLTTFDGVATRRSYSETSSMFGACVQVLQSSEIARAYGLPPAPTIETWPLRGTYSGQGAHLIEAISEMVGPTEKKKTRRDVLAAQRIAFDGARTVNAAVSGNLEDEDELEDIIIPVAFTWWTALKEVKSAEAPSPQVSPQVSQTEGSAPTLEMAVGRSIRPLR